MRQSEKRPEVAPASPYEDGYVMYPQGYHALLKHAGDNLSMPEDLVAIPRNTVAIRKERDK